MQYVNILCNKYVVAGMTALAAAGVPCVDASVVQPGPGLPRKHFRCHCCLLFWTGDYPAQAKVSGMHDKCCHWCEVKSAPAPEINRRVWTGQRRYLRTCVCVCL